MAWALLLLVVVPILELYVMVQVAQEIGFWEMLGLLILLSIAGIWVIRYAGLRAWRRVAGAGLSGEPVAPQAADGAMVFLAGVLLVVPGFVTGGLGSLLLLPPVRALLRNRFQRRLSSARRRGRIITATYDRGEWRTTDSGPPTQQRPRGELE